MKQSGNKKKQGISIGIDASRNRSGGAIAYLVGILTEADPRDYGIEMVHLWAYRSLLDAIPDQPWLIKHNPRALEKSIVRQLWWQGAKLARESAAAGIQILFTTDASTVCRFKPMVILSQDMLSYEPGIMKLYGMSTNRVRLIAILLLQNAALRHACGAIFLTRYAAEVIQKSCGRLANVAFIPHGIGKEFTSGHPRAQWPDDGRRPVRILYISNISMYKHQWVVVKAVTMLRRKGYSCNIELVGASTRWAKPLLDQALKRYDPEGEFVTVTGFIAHDDLPRRLAGADIFLFASSCENMPVTLIEAMAAGLPIAASNRGPMPEVLQDGGVYFDPEDDVGITNALERIIVEPELRTEIAKRSREYANQYSWGRTARETYAFITDTYRRNV